MYVNDNKIHGSHGIHDQIQSLHHFVQGIIGALSPTNHDGKLTQGTLGDLMFEAVNKMKAIPSFITLSRLGGTRAISAIMPI